MIERRVIHFAGHVQGVGFRYQVRTAAMELPVKGFVRNLHDGRVELVVEARPADIEQLLAHIRDRMGDYIQHINSRVEAATGEFLDFEIRR
jgi:acylphosphatase